MDRFDGTAARQLVLIDEGESPVIWREAGQGQKPVSIRLLQKDIYLELAKRRRRAQIAARHMVERDRDN
jgi:hypothetical protein